MKQTAVSWLIQTMHNSQSMEQPQIDEVFEQAKEMEKQQIIDAYTDEDNIQWDKQLRTRAAEQYYNNTFNNK